MIFFFFTATATTEIYTLSLHDALPIFTLRVTEECSGIRSSWVLFITSILASHLMLEDRWRRLVLVAFVFPLAIVRKVRKSTRLNSSHPSISYAVFCLKKKKKMTITPIS